MSDIQGFCLGASGAVWSKLIQRLEGEKVISFSYVAGSQDVISLPCLQKAHTDELIALYRGDLLNKPLVNSFSLDSTVLNEYQQAELTCLEISDRMDQGYSFSRPERERLFLTLLDYWLNLLNQLKPKFIVFTTTPHSVAEYCLYVIAKKNNIPVLMFMQITAIQRVIELSDYKKIDASFFSTYETLKNNSPEDITLPEDIERYLLKFNSNYESAMPDYLKKRLSNEKSGFSISDANLETKKVKSTLMTQNLRIKNIASRCFQRVSAMTLNSRQTIKKPPRNYLKMPFEAFESSEGLNYEQWQAYKKWAKQYKEGLLNTYEKYTQPCDLNVKYVYAPLHYQPERTTCPEAERYSNQLLMLKVLAQSLPKDWIIYVKENPTQLLPSTAHGERGRYAYFYQDLAEIHKVKIVSMKEDPFSLIDNSQMVATLTGTTGWESILRRKPVLCFGNAWYESCEGAFSVRTAEQCKIAINHIMEAYEIDRQNVRKFLSAIDQHSFKGFLRVNRYDDPSYGEVNNIENMFHMISRFTQTKLETTNGM